MSMLCRRCKQYLDSMQHQDTGTDAEPLIYPARTNVHHTIFSCIEVQRKVQNKTSLEALLRLPLLQYGKVMCVSIHCAEVPEQA